MKLALVYLLHSVSILAEHYSDVIMRTLAYQIISLTIVYSTVYSDADQNKHQSSASLALQETGEFPAQMASNADNVSIWWRHHGLPSWHGTAPQIGESWQGSQGTQDTALFMF